MPARPNTARKVLLAAVVAALMAIMLVPAAAHALPSPAVISSVSPSQGPSAGGTSVTINGTGFDTATLVTFGGTPATFSVNIFGTVITATAPAHALGTYDILVTNGSLVTNTPSVLDHYTYTTNPLVFGISPSLGPVGGGTFVTVTGSGFTNAMVVTFGGVAGTGLNVQNDNVLTVFSPAHFAQSVFVVVWVNGVPSTGGFASTFTYGGGLSVTGVSPSSGPPTGGTTVTVTGSGFLGATAISFGGVFGTILQIQSDNVLLALTPAHFAGSVHVNVWVGPTQSPSNFSDGFLYNGGLTVFSVTPASGPTAGGTAVTITGAGFLGAVSVTFGGTSATNFFVQSDNQILAVTPPHFAGTVDVVVYNGATSTIFTGSGLFTYTSVLSVTGLTPNSGPAGVGTNVTISGTGFLNATSVSFGGTPATNMNIVSDSQITVSAPSRSAGTVHVTVFAGDIGSAATTADLFTYTAAPASDPPARFAGRVVMNGGIAPTGTGVQAYIGSALCGSTTVFSSSGDTRYVLDVSVADATHPGCGAEGATVTFWVGGSQAQSATWHNYQLNNQDLVIGAPSAPPPPTSVPTPPPSAPLPPNTGSVGAATATSSGGSPSWMLFALLGTAAMVVATGTLAGIRRRATADIVPPATAQASVEAGDETPARRGGGWLAIAGLGAAAVVAGTVMAKRRRK